MNVFIKIKCTIIFLILFSASLHSMEVVTVYPIDKIQPTGIYVRKGDRLKITVTGKWSLWDKYDLVGGEGHQFSANEYGNWGALLGKIGSSEIFVIGKGTEIQSNYEGVLYLFPNKGKYKIENQTGNLNVSIEGGIELDKFKKQLEYKALKFIFNSKDKFFPTNIYVKKGETIEIYAFGQWTMWENTYQLTSAEGHNFVADGENWGKLYGAIGSSTGQYFEYFSIGEKIDYKATETGLLSLYPYLDEYQASPNGELEIYIIGGKNADENTIKSVDEMVRVKTEQIALNKINEYRRMSGLRLLEIKKEFSKTAFNHAKYMVLNNTFDRDEKEGKLNFTGRTLEERLKQEGFEGKSREMFCQTEYVLNAINLFADTVYHRLRLLNPDLKYLGYGSYKSTDKTIHVFDFGYIEDNEEKQEWEKIIYPANESTDVKTSWEGNESPDPFPTGTSKPLGYPISIMFRNELKQVVEAVLTDEKGKSVSCFIISPETDLNNKKMNAIILVPKKTLEYNTRYTVNIKVILGKKEEEKSYAWTFVTENQNF